MWVLAGSAGNRSTCTCNIVHAFTVIELYWDLIVHYICKNDILSNTSGQLAPIRPRPFEITVNWNINILLYFLLIVLDESTIVLDQLKSIRSELEGTNVDYATTEASERVLQKLRQLILMHTPLSVTENVRAQFKELIDDVLSGRTSKKSLLAQIFHSPEQV